MKKILLTSVASVIVAVLAVLGITLFQEERPEESPIEVIKVTEEIAEPPFGADCLSEAKSRSEKIQTCPELSGRSAQELFKANEIKDDLQLETFTRDGYTIEIKSKEVEQVGDVTFVVVKARAWKDGMKLGFGKDDTIEWERFRIQITSTGGNKHLTHLITEDPAGTIEVADTRNGVPVVVKYREDPAEQFKKRLTYIVSQTGVKTEGVIPDSEGQTNTTFNPAAGASEPFDGWAKSNGRANKTFSDIQDDPGNASGDTDISRGYVAALEASATTDQFQRMTRGIIGFGTSGLAGQVVDDCFLSVAVASKDTGLGDTNVYVVSASPASASSVADGDYDSLGTTQMHASTTNIAGLMADVQNALTCDADGEAHVNTSGNTFFGLRTQWDVDNSFTGTWANTATTRLGIRFADNADSSLHPILSVDHSAAPVVPEDDPSSPMMIFY